MIGVVVVTTDASIGEVSDTPVIKKPWFSVTPNNDAKKSRARSCGVTCSRRVNSDRIQNAAAAPTIRKVVSDSGPTRPLCNTAFDMGDMTPQSRLAPSMARWPVYIPFDCIDDLFKFFNWDSSDPLNFLKFSGCTEKSHFCTYPCAKVLFFRFGCLTPDRLLK